jgi:putative transposase
VPTPYPKESRADVIAATRASDKSRAQIARSFGVSETCLARWLEIAEYEDGLTSPATEPVGDLEVENRELRRRTKQLEQENENEILRRATAYFARDSSQNDVPLVLDLVADNIPVAVTCRVLGFSKQAFYRWRAGPVTQQDWDDAHLINAAIEIHHDDPGFGYRFIADELPGRGPSPAGTG